MEDDLSLDEIAESVGLSRAYFARMFRKSAGERPFESRVSTDVARVIIEYKPKEVAALIEHAAQTDH